MIKTLPSPKQWTCTYCYTSNTCEDIVCSQCSLYSTALAIRCNHQHPNEVLEKFITENGGSTLDMWNKIISYLPKADQQNVTKIELFSFLNPQKYNLYNFFCE